MEVEDVKPSKSALDAETTRFREEASRRRATMIRQMMSKVSGIIVHAFPDFRGPSRMLVPRKCRPSGWFPPRWVFSRSA